MQSRQSKGRILTVDRSYRSDRWHREYRQFPRLRLQGNWLERAGFATGSRVVVAVAAGRLTISKVGD